jgi:hypothetical protein
LNTAAADLASAMVAFSGQIKTDGAKINGYDDDELDALIATANAAKQGVETSANGTDVNSNVLWVTSGDLAALNSAITSAEGATDANRDTRYNALYTAITTFNAAKSYGTRTAKTVTITGLPPTASGLTIQVGLFTTQPNSPAATPVAGGEGIVGGNGTVIVSLYNITDNPPTLWAGGTGPYYVGVSTGSGSYVTNTAKSFSGDNLTVTPADYSSGEELYGTLTVTGGLSGEFMVVVVTGNITASNIASLVGAPVAEGAAESSPAEIEWYSGTGSGTYGVIIASADDFSVKYQNGVTFTNGSGSVNWNNMTGVNFTDLSVGNLTFAGGSPGEGWSILIVNGPLTGTLEDLNAMDAYVAAALSMPGMPGGMIFTIGATGGTFNPNGTYSIIYMDDEGMKYGNYVSFSGGNATINLSSLIDFDFSVGPIHTEDELNALIATANAVKQGVETSRVDGTDISSDTYWVTPAVMEALNTAIYAGGDIDSRYSNLEAALYNFYAAMRPGTKTDVTPEPSSKSVTITGLSAYNGLEIQAALFATKPNDLIGEEPSAFGMESIIIQGGRATVSLYNNKDFSPWNGTGNWYVAFAIDEDDIFVSRSTVYFSDSNPNPTVALSDCEKMDLGPVPTAGNTVTITGLSAYIGYPIQVGLFQTPPTSNDRDPEVFGSMYVQSDRITVPLYEGNFADPSNISLWNGTGDWYVSFMIGSDENSMVAAYVTYNSVYFSAANPNPAVDVSNCEQVAGGTDDSGKPDEVVYGTLAVSGLSNPFEVYVVNATISSSNFATVMGSSVAEGFADGSVAELKWYSGNGSGTYGIVVFSAAGIIKYQNNVFFSNGSGSVNWNAMTEVNLVDLSEGTLNFTGGSPSALGSVLIANGPITSETIWNAMESWVAGASSEYSSSTGGWMIITAGAPGGTFNPNGTYSIIYMGDEGMKYGNNISFNNGNATINLASLTDVGGGWGGPVTGGEDYPDYPSSFSNNARSLFRFAR